MRRLKLVTAAVLVCGLGVALYAQTSFTGIGPYFELSRRALALAPNTAANPALVSTSDATSGIFFPATGQIGFAINGAQVATLASSGLNWSAPTSSGNGATVTVTAAQSGTVFYFDRAAGIVYTLPAPTPGLWYDFVNTVTITSNNAEIATNTGTVFLQGVLYTGVAGAATGSAWQCNGTTHVAVKMNGTTSGGILGGRVHVVALSATLWQIDGQIVGSVTEVTPCSTTT